MANKVKADNLKTQGNEKYKARQYEQAIRLYKEAAALQPNAPLEDGRYKDSLESCKRALVLLDKADDTNLRAKVLTRRAKLLLLLSAEDSSLFEEAQAACAEQPNADLSKAALQRRQIAGDVVNKRITSMPRYRHCATAVMEQYGVGHDQPESLFRAQFSDSEMYNGGHHSHPLKRQFHMELPADGKPFEFAALFVGIGDARHLFASLTDLAVNLEKSKKPSQTVKVHFRLNDIHPATLSRDLVFLTALNEISCTHPSTRSSSPRVKELFLMLQYVYWGTTMPPAAHEALRKQIQIVYDLASRTSDEGEPIVLDWFYMDARTVRTILPRLRFWLDEGPSLVTFDQILPPKLDSDPGPPTSFNMGIGQDDLDIMAKKKADNDKSSREKYREQAKSNLAVRSQFKAQAESMGLSVDAFIDKMLNISSEEDQTFMSRVPASAFVERKVFSSLRVMVPPVHAGEPKDLEAVFKIIRSGDEQKIPSKATLEAAHAKIRKRWIANYTLLDKQWMKMVVQEFTHCPYQGIRNMIPHYLKEKEPEGASGGAYTWSTTAFGLIADAMMYLREWKNGGLTIEMVQGDGYALMDAIRLGTLPDRKPEFPVLFDRIHLSNVTDYIGGHFANFTTTAPLIKTHSKAYYTSCSLLNSNIWEGKFMKEFAKSFDSALWTYAGVTLPEVQAAYGVELCCTPSYAGNYHTFRRITSLPKNKRLSRNQLMVVIYSILWRTILPVQYKDHRSSLSVREPQNVHGFFRLLESLKQLGYPTHVLADVVESILDNKVLDGFPPHEVAPVLLASRTEPLVTICTTPFKADFEVAAALWEPRLFPICSASLPPVDTIERYSVQLTRVQHMLDYTIPPTHMLLELVFGLPKDMDGGSVDPRKLIVGTREYKSSLQFVSTCYYNHDTKVATVLLARSRMQQFRKEGYEVALINTSFWRIQSGKVKCSEMVLVGDVDSWDKQQTINKPKARELTSTEEMGFGEDMLGGRGGSGGLGGLGGLAGRAGLGGLGGLGGMGGLGGLAGLAGMPGMPDMPDMSEYENMDVDAMMAKFMATMGPMGGGGLGGMSKTR